MAEDSFTLGQLGSFGLGATAALLLVLLARTWSHRFLSTAGPRTRTYAFVAMGLLAALSSVALVAGRSPERGTGAAAAMPSTDFERQHGIPAERSLQDAIAASATIVGQGGAGMSTAANPMQGETASLLARAEEHRRKRDFKQACELYADLARRGAMTADSWADYADAQASLAGRIAGEPARAIEAALALEPRHAKALWLQASLAHEEGRYQDALDTWQRLLEIVPPGSSDARIVESNITEATRLASN